MTNKLFDIAIIGCGPAGAVLSRELCLMGYQVITFSKARTFSGFEGLSERAWKGLEHNGCHNALASVGAEVRRIAQWNGDRLELNRERVVERQNLDEALIQDVMAVGAKVSNSKVRHLTPGPAGWEIHHGSHKDTPVRARYLVEARGRQASRTKASWTLGPATMSLGRRYISSEHQKAMTWVATFEQGWAWYAANSTGRAVLQIFVSIAYEPLPARRKLDAYFNSLLEIIPGIEPLLKGYKINGHIYARDARTSLCNELVSADYARVGDAAFAIDPLSGNGMFEAISGAMALAPVINTLFQRPEETDIALGFYREKLNLDFWRMARTGRDFYRQELRWPDLPFWQERQAWPDEEPSHHAAGAAHIAQRAVSELGLIRTRDVIISDDHPRGIGYLDGIPLVELLCFLKNRDDYPQQSCLDAAAKQFNVPTNIIQNATNWLRWRALLKS